jgi:hypothetical protein
MKKAVLIMFELLVFIIIFEAGLLSHDSMEEEELYQSLRISRKLTIFQLPLQQC